MKKKKRKERNLTFSSIFLEQEPPKNEDASLLEQLESYPSP